MKSRIMMHAEQFSCNAAQSASNTKDIYCNSKTGQEIKHYSILTHSKKKNFQKWRKKRLILNFKNRVNHLCLAIFFRNLKFPQLL